MKVGDEVWVYDSYRRGNDKFVKQYIVGETKVSWIMCGFQNPSEALLKRCDKIKKSEMNIKFFVTVEDKEKYLWTVTAAREIGERVRDLNGRRITDYDKLKRIEAILNEE